MSSYYMPEYVDPRDLMSSAEPSPVSSQGSSVVPAPFSSPQISSKLNDTATDFRNQFASARPRNPDPLLHLDVATALSATYNHEQSPASSILSPSRVITASKPATRQATRASKRKHSSSSVDSSPISMTKKQREARDNVRIYHLRCDSLLDWSPLANKMNEICGPEGGKTDWTVAAVTGRWHRQARKCALDEGKVYTEKEWQFYKYLRTDEDGNVTARVPASSPSEEEKSTSPMTAEERLLDELYEVRVSQMWQVLAQEMSYCTGRHVTAEECRNMKRGRNRP